MPAQSFNNDDKLAEFFTDVEHLRTMFKTFVTAPTLPKRLLVVHGVGGVGKSSVLRMFRMYCKSEHILVALASGDEAKSALDVLYRWADDLKAEGVALASFAKTFELYRSILAKVDEQAKKTQDARGRIADVAGKAASKTAEAVGGALAGAAIGSIVPGLGTAVGGAIGSVVGGVGGEALIDWLSGFLKRPDIDLLLDPTKRLTDEFLANIGKIAGKRRIVLIMDTFEQMTVLDHWARDVAQRLHVNVLFVIAGRGIPNWDRAWQSWMTEAQIEELKPMTEDVMRDLVRRYYATMRGGAPDPVQVEAIIHFAQGLPVVVTSAVQLWVKYKVEDFQSVKTEIVANLVDRLMEGVPNQLIPALEAAASVRWFDQPILRAVTGLSDVREIYDELRRFPFVRVRREGLALHDAVREIMDENLRVQDPERHKELHQRSIAYFEKQLGTGTSNETERFGLERLYHNVLADEYNGLKMFHGLAEELFRTEMISRLQTLLNDFTTYPLQDKRSRQWVDYYSARLDLLMKGARETVTQAYRKLLEEVADSQLRAYILCDLGGIYLDRDIIRETGEEGKKLLEQAISLMPPTDSRLSSIYSHLKGYYIQKGRWNECLKILEKQMKFFFEKRDEYGLTRTIKDYGFIYGYLGDWQKSLKLYELAHQKMASLPSNLILKADANSRPWYLIWSGKLKLAETGLEQAMVNFTNLGSLYQAAIIRRELAFVSALQDNFEFANKTFQEIQPLLNQPARIGDVGTLYGFWGYSRMREGDLGQAIALLTQSWEIKSRLEDTVGYQEILYWLGLVNECDFKLSRSSTSGSAAASFYQQAISYKKFGRRHFECGAFTGLIRVKCLQGEHGSIPPLLVEAEKLAQQYEYNDHLASLRLTQAALSEVKLGYFKEAMIYALRYNRFLLDEVLGGRPQGTQLSPIIPYCLGSGEDGRRILSALHEWWMIGLNYTGTPRPETISPVPEGIPLLEAERIAREREPGNGSPQRTVAEQIMTALAGNKTY